jgi:putative oxidoreductase
MVDLRTDRSSHRYLSYTDTVATGAVGDFLLLLGRVLVGWIFLQSGFGKVMGLSGFVASQTANGVPTVLAYIAPFLEFLAGAGLVLGLATRYSALGLIAFTLAATWIAHRYWTFPEAQQRMQSIQFWKNVAIIGGLFAFFAVGGGRFSLDRWLSRR